MFHAYRPHFMKIYMNKNCNQGVYADLIKQYLTYRRSLGFKMQNVEFILGAFNRFAIARSHTVIGISMELFEEWETLKTGETSVYRYDRVLIVKCFSSYLQINGYESYIPKLPKRVVVFTPHIYTSAEVTALFQASDKRRLKCRNMDSQSCSLPTLLRMLYGTGLRLGEALKLKNRDVHLDDSYLQIRCSSSKNEEERIVPISGSLVEVCRDFIAYKLKQLIDCDADNYFFTSLNGKKCGEASMYGHFRETLCAAGISHQGRGKGPRLHDFRHTFCVNALVKMSEAGLDLYHSMPVLSTYIGHKTIESTNVYVRLTAEMYPELIKKANNAYQCIFPEIGIGGDTFSSSPKAKKHETH
jgi:integrase/recombinase XerD